MPLLNNDIMFGTCIEMKTLWQKSKIDQSELSFFLFSLTTWDLLSHITVQCI